MTQRRAWGPLKGRNAHKNMPSKDDIPIARYSLGFTYDGFLAFLVQNLVGNQKSHVLFPKMMSRDRDQHS